jgi:hypothetical protein
MQFFFVQQSASKSSSLHFNLDGIKDRNSWELSVISEGIILQKDLMIFNDSKEIINCSIIPASTELQILPPETFQIKPKETIHRTLQWNLIGKEMGNNHGELVIRSDNESININYYYWFEPTNYSVSLSMKEMTIKVNDQYVITKNGDFYYLLSENYIMDGRMYVDVRFIITFLGFNIFEEFNFSDKSMIFFRKGKKYYFKYLADQILIDGKPMKTHKLHIIRDMRMSLPIRLIADLIGYSITWDPKDQRVTLYHHH